MLRSSPSIDQRPTAEWLERFAAAGVPAGPVTGLTEMLEHPQTLAREMVTEVRHTKLGPIKTLGFPVKLSASPASIARGAPLLGEHTREVLLAHGYTEAAVQELRNAGVIVCGA